MKLGRIICTLLIAVFTLSCTSNSVYDKYENIPDFEWNQGKIFRFEVDITDTTHTHNVFVNVRNSGDYAYSNLWLFVKTISPDNEVDEQKIEVKLADETGDWYGSGFGDIFDLKVPFKQKMVFPKSGKYVFEIAQGMYDHKLKGIVNVGIRIEKGKQ
jgi:gliding motility-associated lipoprotein GldH